MPNITGYAYYFDDQQIVYSGGALYSETGTNRPYDADSDQKAKWNAKTLRFDASKSNAIYGKSSGVRPPNYAVYAYIYAGKIVK